MTDILIRADTLVLADDLRIALAGLWPDARLNLDPSRPYDAVLQIGGQPPVADARPILWLHSVAGVDDSLPDATRSVDDLVRLPAPVRLVHLLQRLKDMVARPAMHDWHGYRLDMAQRLWHTPDALAVTLTEKEVALLAYLGRCHPSSVTRDDLLRDVWHYAAGADTHTVETHLYRLRQKIETDPERPAIVVNNGDGYILGILS